MISLVITTIIFCILEFSYNKIKRIYFAEIDKKIGIQNVLTREKIRPKEYKETNDNNVDEYIWQIEIPKINLVAPIAEGTSQEVMLEYVGHFEDTEKIYGNVGLAAHNRGFPINYFGRLKELQIGDKIIYKTIYDQKIYEVALKTIIADTDWSYLQGTDENIITLITCVENRPNKRLCIQGIEIKEE